MNLVFICSPYRGDTKKNIENVKRYCMRADVRSMLPIAPHLYFTQFLDDNSFMGRTDGMIMGKTLMKYCTEVWIFCNELTEGMIEELAEAKKLGLPLKFYTPDMEELNHDNYIIHPELGPGYRRLITETFGDRFTYDPGCSEDCSKCSRRRGENKYSEPAAENGSKDRTEEVKLPVNNISTGSKRRYFWRRFFRSK